MVETLPFLWIIPLTIIMSHAGGSQGASAFPQNTPVAAHGLTRVAGEHYSAAMQPDGPIPTKANLLNYRLTYENILHVRLPSYYVGSGRYCQVDTARKNALSNALLELEFGKGCVESTTAAARTLSEGLCTARDGK